MPKRLQYANVFRLPMERLGKNGALVAALEAVNDRLYAIPRLFRGDIMSMASHVYIARRVKEIVGYLFFQYGFISLGNLTLPAIHLGPLAVAKGHQQHGVSGLLRKAFVAYELRKGGVDAAEPLLWSTVGHAVSYRILLAGFSDLAPAPDGSFMPQAAEIAQAIRLRFGNDGKIPTSHPFVMRSVTKRRLHDDVAGAIGSIPQNRVPSIFTSQDIREDNGDRLIVTFRLPRG